MPLCRLLDAHAPESTALVFAQRRWTYAEVESAIDQHPDVVASAVVAAPDAEAGQVPVAFAVVREAPAQRG